MREGVIYSISCPIHKKAIYVGQTVSPKSQFNSYFSTSNGTAIELYIDILNKKELKPIFTIHIRCDEDDLDEQEYKLLNQFIADGFPMLNRRHNNLDNYNSARELYLGIPQPDKNPLFEVIDLTIMHKSA